ncbi:MAG: glycerophosphodiester phosphodiesterase family protein [Actinomycetota bacterium]
MVKAFLNQPVPFAMAHQGGTDVAPGNTMAAFDHAVSLGYRYLETDVQATNDGVLVLFHDDELGPLTGGTGTVADHSWAELSALRIEGHPIPRLDELVDRHPDARLNLDPKNDGAVEPLITFLRERALVDQVCVGSFADARISRLSAALGPGLCRSPGPRGVAWVLVRAAVFRWGRSPVDALQIPTSQFGIPLTSGWLIRRIKRLGPQVHVWTVNDEAEMGRLLDNGADAIITDAVELCRTVLQARGAWPPD